MADDGTGPSTLRFRVSFREKEGGPFCPAGGVPTFGEDALLAGRRSTGPLERGAPGVRGVHRAQHHRVPHTLHLPVGPQPVVGAGDGELGGPGPGA